MDVEEPRAILYIQEHKGRMNRKSQDSAGLPVQEPLSDRVPNQAPHEINAIQPPPELAPDRPKDLPPNSSGRIHPKLLPPVQRALSEDSPDSDTSAETSNSPELMSQKMPNLWIYDGEAYDLADFVKRIRERLNEPTIKAKIARMDSLFDAVSIGLCIVYVLTQLLRLSLPQYMPLYLFAPLMAALRISLAGAGHYLIHRAQVRFNKFASHVFDINYVPMAFVVIDGHTLMHHFFTQSEVDVKRNVFTAMMELPRYYRIPLHTVHKLAHVLTGMFVRNIKICVYAIKYGVNDLYGSW